jgi:hypothetical protein
MADQAGKVPPDKKGEPSKPDKGNSSKGVAAKNSTISIKVIENLTMEDKFQNGVFGSEQTQIKRLINLFESADMEPDKANYQGHQGQPQRPAPRQRQQAFLERQQTIPSASTSRQSPSWNSDCPRQNNSFCHTSQLPPSQESRSNSTSRSVSGQSQPLFDKDKPHLDPITDARTNTSSASNVSQPATTIAAETTLQPAIHIVVTEEVFPKVAITASKIISMLQQQVLNTQEELDKAYGLVDLLLFENQKLRDATTDFYEYVKTELQTSNQVSELSLEAQSQTIQKSDSQSLAFVEDPTTLARSNLEGELLKQLNSEFVQSFPKCSICPDIEHELPDCPLFKTLDRNERGTIVCKTNPCRHCLKRGHNRNKCQTDIGKICGIDGCHRFEHSLIHSNFNTDVVNSQILVCNLSKEQTRKGITTIALFDTESDQTLIDMDTAVKLGLKQTSLKCTKRFPVLNRQLKTKTYRVEVHFTSMEGLITQTLVAYTVKDLIKTNHTVDWQKAKQFPHRREIPIKSSPQEASPISIIIGRNYDSLFQHLKQ